VNTDAWPTNLPSYSGASSREVVAYIGLGANLGDSAATLLQAAREIGMLRGVTDTTLSPMYCTAPVDAGGPDYTNAVLRITTSLGPEELLKELQRIELAHGRQRPFRNAPRTLDLDLLLHGDEVRDSEFLTLPHPRMHERAFVLQPLLDLEPNLLLPEGSAKSLLAACSDQRLERLPPA